MSATGRGSPRNLDDFYGTPGWAVRRFLEKFHPPPGERGGCTGRWLEPGAGNGAIMRAATDYILERTSADLPKWTAIDIRRPVGRADEVLPRPADCTWLIQDFLDWTPIGMPPFAFAIGNPPYSLARRFADKCFRLAKMTALLLRLNFAASAERQPWFREHPADIYILPNRPSFTPNGRTDATEYAWFVWGDGAGLARDPKVVWLDRTPAEERRRT